MTVQMETALFDDLTYCDRKKVEVKDNDTAVNVVSKSTGRGEIITRHLFWTKLISHLFPPATHVIEI